jgi:hypothetical protein
LVQQGTLFVNLLYGRRKNAKGSSGYCSLSRVVGSRSSGDSTEHGHLVYDLFNKIIHNSSSGSVLTVECASDELNFSRVTLRNCVEYFFKCGLLDYFSMQKGDKRDSAGRWLGGRTAKTSIMANDLSRLVWSYLLQGIGEFAMELQNAQESGTLVQTPRSRRPNFGELENMGYGVLAHTQVERYLADRRESIETVQARERF